MCVFKYYHFFMKEERVVRKEFFLEKNTCTHIGIEPLFSHQSVCKYPLSNKQNTIQSAERKNEE